MFSTLSLRLLARGVSKGKYCRSWGLGRQRFFFTKLVILLWIQSRTMVQYALQVEIFLHLSQTDTRVSSPEHYFSLTSFSARTFFPRGSDRWPGCHDTSLNCSFSSLPSDWKQACVHPISLNVIMHTVDFSTNVVNLEADLYSSCLVCLLGSRCMLCTVWLTVAIDGLINILVNKACCLHIETLIIAEKIMQHQCLSYFASTAVAVWLNKAASSGVVCIDRQRIHDRKWSWI